MEISGQIAGNYQIQNIPKSGGTIGAGGGQAQVLCAQGIYDGDSQILMKMTYANGAGIAATSYLCQRREFWPFLTQAQITIDGVLVGNFINLAAAQYQYYQHNMMNQKDKFATLDAVTTISKKQWNIIQVGKGNGAQGGAPTTYVCSMRLDHFLAGSAFEHYGGKLRVWNQMTINFQVRPLVAGDFSVMTNLSNAIADAPNPISQLDFNLIGKIYPNDPFVNSVQTKIYQQYFSSATVNANYSVASNQVSKYQGLLIKNVGAALTNTAIQFEEPLQTVTEINIQRNGYQLYKTINTDNAVAEACQMFSQLASSQASNTNSLSAIFTNVFSNSIINHVINLSAAQDVIFTYQIQEANPNMQ